MTRLETVRLPRESMGQETWSPREVDKGRYTAVRIDFLTLEDLQRFRDFVATTVRYIEHERAVLSRAEWSYNSKDRQQYAALLRRLEKELNQ